MERTVDYDRVAPSYNRRFAGDAPGGEAQALAALVRRLQAASEPHADHRPPTARVLEVGCGTGHWLAGLSPFAAQAIGLDLSAGMLAQAQRRAVQLGLVRGRAGQLPFPASSFNLVYCVNAIHHFQQQRVFVSEARRLLRPGGALAIVGMDPRAHRHGWYVYDYFEDTYDLDLDRFPSWGTTVDWLAAAGFERIEWRIVHRIVDHKFGRDVLGDPFLEKEATSQLTLLSDEAYTTGLRRIEEAIAVAELAGETLTFPTDLMIAMVVGWAAG
jgi:ubiquinone/menaquinone biosynthesis C-methylase UbiE